jgi:anthranilate synthase/aminodeoxychorismate synthase-like glutamine amidotransferase
MKVLILDNYDSFTFNLYQYVGKLLSEREKSFTLDVFRNDHITLKQVIGSYYDKIIISPGPGNPANKDYFGVCAEVLLTVGREIPTLGVCLGMQGIAHYFGGKVVRAENPMHGKTSAINHDEKGIFLNLPQHIEVMRYHSLIADRASLPDCLRITATAVDSGEIMGLRHTIYPIEGIQFHPESFATEAGMLMLENFLFQTNK